MKTGVTVAVDARALHVSGIGRYLGEVIARLLNDSRFNCVTLLGDIPALRRFVGEIGSVGEVRFESMPTDFYSFRVQARWLRHRISGRLAADVFFFPHFDAPVVGLPSRSVVTVQDLIHFKIPELFPVWRRRLAGMVLDRVVSNAALVVVSSESTRRDLMERKPDVGNNIAVVPFGADCRIRDLGTMRSESAPMPPFLLCVGNRKPHKNQIAAVEVLARLRDEFPALHLVFAGPMYSGWAKVRDRAETLGIQSQLLDLGKVSDGRLAELYAACEFLLFPSLYEGFGLPVLEAMTAGAPVIASNRSSIPEVVGDAGILCDPDDYASMARSARRIMLDPEFRDALVSRGRARAAQFTWEHTTTRVADLLHQVGCGGDSLLSTSDTVSPDA